MELRDVVHIYTTALSRPDEASLAALGRVLAEGAIVRGIIGGGSDATKILEGLASPTLPPVLAGVEWGEPGVHGDTATVTGRLPAGRQLGGMTLAMTVDSSMRIVLVEQQMIPATPPPPTRLALTPGMKAAVNGAFANGTPVMVAYADAEGQPHLSPRGTAQAYSDDQLAVWNRDPQGGFARAIAVNPKVALFYRDPKTRETYQFLGRARAESDPAVRDRVYDNSPVVEQNMDARRLGVAVIIDLDSVEGGGPGGRVRMQRMQD